MSKKWQRIGDCPCSGPAAVPAHRDVVELQAALVNIGDNQNRAPGLEQCGFKNRIRCRRAVMVPRTAFADGRRPPLDQFSPRNFWQVAKRPALRHSIEAGSAGEAAPYGDYAN